MEQRYIDLVLDPRCLKPASEIINNNDRNTRFIYIDALDAIRKALAQPYITESEVAILESIRHEIHKNRFC